MSVTTLSELFPDEESALKWFESIIWADGRLCPRCDGVNTYETSNSNGMPYRCRDCSRYFSVKTSTVLASTKIPLQKWVWAIFLECASVHGISSMKLHRDLGIGQDSAWHMLHRIREGMHPKIIHVLQGISLQESAQDEIQGSQHESLNLNSEPQTSTSSGACGNPDHPTNQLVANVDSNALEPICEQFVNHSQLKKSFISKVEHTADKGEAFHNQSQKQWTASSTFGEVSLPTHDSGSFMEGLKHARRCTYRHISAKHLNRYISQFAYKHALRDFNIIDQMTAIVQGMVGKQLKIKELVVS